MTKYFALFAVAAAAAAVIAGVTSPAEAWPTYIYEGNGCFPFC